MNELPRKVGVSSAIDVIRLDILMQYYPKLGRGMAALQWTDPLGGGPLIQAHLVALLYGHILYIHRETREELFFRVGDLARHTVRNKGATGFEFAPWLLHEGVGGTTHTLWPWLIVPPEQITNPRIYSAILKLGEPTGKTPTGRWLQLDMAAGQERVYAPSSVLIAIAGLSENGDRTTRYLLARLLWQMNVYWGTPNQVPFFSEALAYAAAVSAIHAEPFRTE
ncbi:MAG TPA: hypothetical protein VGE50_01370 [Gammaproteobacteria bacterium]